MPAAYSNDLRCQVLDAVALGIPKKDVCEMFGLGLNSLYLWIQRLEQTGSFTAPKQGIRKARVTKSQTRKHSKALYNSIQIKPRQKW
ncbi:helix-turn-helix domain-containing protein [[Leptolyngbya] sp. PCC 7376]|uniref:helix-turn-helix domain-containing protein n=1 Tax=[Leptolyngbya] sp. PCC 7376 TaxID=111781 RepID=UPI000A078F17|nr:helix-turn-helix domain-containing protein [[Leptolyngbya] sp. PCC 7376]